MDRIKCENGLIGILQQAITEGRLNGENIDEDIGYFTALLQKHTHQIDQNFINFIETMDEHYKEIICYALWFAGTDEASAILFDLIDNSENNKIIEKVLDSEIIREVPEGIEPNEFGIPFLVGFFKATENPVCIMSLISVATEDITTDNAKEAIETLGYLYKKYPRAARICDQAEVEANHVGRIINFIKAQASQNPFYLSSN